MNDPLALNDPLAAIRGSLRARVDGWATMDLATIRSDFAAYMAEVGPMGAAAARPVHDTIGGVPGVWIGDRDAPPGLFVHGGGFQIGGVGSHGGLVVRLAVSTGLRLWLPEYRLAPEHRFPAAIDDIQRTYQGMIKAGQAPLAIMGDSAGGALALLAAMGARDMGLTAARAVILLSPWLDLSLSGDSYRNLADRDPFSKTPQLRAMAHSYLGREGPDKNDPQVSPLFGDLERLPPILIHAGDNDITVDDSHALHARGAKGVTLSVYPGMCHHFQVFEELPQAAESLAAIGAWLDPILKRAT